VLFLKNNANLHYKNYTMPKISNKGIEMPESPIRKLAPYADAAKKRGVKVFHLNIGQPDIKSPKVALDAIKSIDREILEYSPSAGYESYRTKLAHFYTKKGLAVATEDVIITTGGSEALLFAIGSTCDPDDEIIVIEPFYANYNGFAAEMGVKIAPVISYIENDFALPAIAEFENKINPKTKAILICNPGNPTGYSYTKAEVQALGDLAKKHDLFLIADEVYREFIYENGEHHSILNLTGLEQHAVMIDSVSKRYSMCGARIGCIVTKNKALKESIMKFAQARLSPPTVEQIACEAAIDTPQSYFDEVIKEYKSRRDTLIEALQSIDGIKVSLPKGAFYCIASLPVANADDFAQWLLESYSLNNQTVMVAPAAGFYSTEGVGLNEIRIAYVLKKEDLKQAAQILKEALLAYNVRQ
jgi:aspartate aminotransferase